MVEISVVVCTYNRSDLLFDCLDSLLHQDIDKNLYEVVIVDNNSTDDTAACIAKFLTKTTLFRSVNESRPGVSHARNRGWREARGTYVAFIDDDGRAASDWVRKILNCFSQVVPLPAAVGGVIRPVYESPPPKWFVEEFELRSWGQVAGFLSPPKLKLGFSGANMAFQRSVIEEYGGFREQFGHNGENIGFGEETDLFYRIHFDKPLFWYDPSLTVYHWTPFRNILFRYRLKRFFIVGRSHSVIMSRTFISRENIFEIICISKSLLGLACTPFVVGIAKKRFLLLVLQGFFYRLGLIWGTFLK